jgi:hypothetical protein
VTKPGLVVNDLNYLLVIEGALAIFLLIRPVSIEKNIEYGFIDVNLAGLKSNVSTKM